MSKNTHSSVNGNWMILGKRNGAREWSECSPARYATAAIAEDQASQLRALAEQRGDSLVTMVEESRW